MLFHAASVVLVLAAADTVLAVVDVPVSAVVVEGCASFSMTYSLELLLLMAGLRLLSLWSSSLAAVETVAVAAVQ